MRFTLFASDKGDLKANVPLTNNYAATTNPGVGNDSSQGYEVGSEWINTSTGAFFTCVSNALGAASWVQSQSQLAATATAQSQPTAPTAPASTTTYFMQGLAGSITPTRSGKILLTISGDFIGSTVTAGDGIDVQLSYGTGTAPANAAALAGTQVGQILGYRNPTTVTAADILVPFSTQAVITGLTLATAYWLDLAAKSIGTASSVGLTNVSVSAVEL